MIRPESQIYVSPDGRLILPAGFLIGVLMVCVRDIVDFQTFEL